MTQRRPIAPKEYMARPQLNEYAYKLDAELTRVLEGYVLPHREKSTFSATEADLYVSRRNYIAQVPIRVSGTSFRYEQLLHQMFWRSHAHKRFKDKKLLFLIGTVGCGKSTFVDYYLRCYCPSQDDSKSEYQKHLIFHVDLKGATTEQEVHHRFLNDLEKSLRARNLFSGFEEQFKGPNQARDKLFRLLQSISDAIRENRLQDIEHVVLCADNIDQSPMGIQKYALNMVQDFLEDVHQIRIYKCIFPLWPQTLRSFQLHHFIRLKRTHYDEVELAPPNIKMVFSKRLRNVLNGYNQSDKKEIKQFVASINRRIDATNKVFLRDISYSNMSLLFSITNEMLSSQSIIKYQQQYDTFRDYQFFDALVCGRYMAHNSSQSKIMNLFQVSPDPSNCYDTLCGPYLLGWFQKQTYDGRDILDSLHAIGFPKALISEALDLFANHHLLHFEDQDRKDDRIYIHYSVVRAYRRLLRAAAVLDNWAQTTPIDPLYRANHLPTVGYDDAHFCRRVEATLGFLRFLGRDEQIFESRLESASGLGALKTFRESVPRLASALEASYYKRLAALRSRGLPDHPSVNSEWWRTIFSRRPR